RMPARSSESHSATMLVPITAASEPDMAAVGETSQPASREVHPDPLNTGKPVIKRVRLNGPSRLAAVVVLCCLGLGFLIWTHYKLAASAPIKRNKAKEIIPPTQLDSGQVAASESPVAEIKREKGTKRNRTFDDGQPRAGFAPNEL